MALRLQTAGSRLAAPALAHSGVVRGSLLARAPASNTFVTSVVPKNAFAAFTHRVQPRQELASKQIVAATDASANYDEGIEGANDYSPVIAVLAFVAVWFNRLHVDRVKLLQALAVLQLFTAAVNVVTRRGVGDKVSNLVGPAVLASAVLSIKHVTYLDTATGLFGYFLSETLEGITGVPFYAFLATLAVALYLGYGTLWYVVAFGVAAAGKVYNSTKSNDPLPVIVLPAIAASIWAVWKEAHFPLALCIYLAQTVWSGFNVIDTLSKRVTD